MELGSFPEHELHHDLHQRNTQLHHQHKKVYMHRIVSSEKTFSVRIHRSPPLQNHRNKQLFFLFFKFQNTLS